MVKVGGGQKAIIIEPNLPTSETGFPVNSEGAWTAQEVCGYLNITQEELDALFSGEMQIVYWADTRTVECNQIITGDPSSYYQTYEDTEAQTIQGTGIAPGAFRYVERYDPIADNNVLIPGLKVVTLGEEFLFIYKLNERYGTSYHWGAPK